MGTLDYQVTLGKRACDFLSRLAPEYKRDMRLLVDRLNHVRCKFFPALAAMRMRLMRAHREDGVQQQHALSSPRFKTTVPRRGYSEV